MRIVGISVYRVELPLHEGSYKWSGGNSVDVFDSTVVAIHTDTGITGYGDICPLGPAYLAAYAAGARTGIAEVAPRLLGLDPTEYDYQVFHVTQAIARQVFPVELNIDDPRFRAGLERLRLLGLKMQAAKRQGFLFGRARRLALLAQIAATFLRLFLLPTKQNTMPADVRMAPAW